MSIERGDEAVTGVAAGSTVDVARIESGEDVADVASVGDVADVANTAAVGVDVDVVVAADAVGVVDAFAEVRLDELVLALRQSPERQVLVTLACLQSGDLLLGLTHRCVLGMS